MKKLKKLLTFIAVSLMGIIGFIAGIGGGIALENAHRNGDIDLDDTTVGDALADSNHWIAAIISWAAHGSHIATK